MRCEGYDMVGLGLRGEMEMGLGRVLWIELGLCWFVDWFCEGVGEVLGRCWG